MEKKVEKQRVARESVYHVYVPVKAEPERKPAAPANDADDKISRVQIHLRESHQHNLHVLSNSSRNFFAKFCGLMARSRGVLRPDKLSILDVFDWTMSTFSGWNIRTFQVFYCFHTMSRDIVVVSLFCDLEFDVYGDVRMPAPRLLYRFLPSLSHSTGISELSLTGFLQLSLVVRMESRKGDLR